MRDTLSARSSCIELFIVMLYARTISFVKTNHYIVIVCYVTFLLNAVDNIDVTRTERVDLTLNGVRKSAEEEDRYCNVLMHGQATLLSISILKFVQVSIVRRRSMCIHLFLVCNEWLRSHLQMRLVKYQFVDRFVILSVANLFRKT